MYFKKHQKQVAFLSIGILLLALIIAAGLTFVMSEKLEPKLAITPATITNAFTKAVTDQKLSEKGYLLASDSDQSMYYSQEAFGYTVQLNDANIIKYASPTRTDDDSSLFSSIAATITGTNKLSKKGDPRQFLHYTTMYTTYEGAGITCQFGANKFAANSSGQSYSFGCAKTETFLSLYDQVTMLTSVYKDTYDYESFENAYVAFSSEKNNINLVILVLDEIVKGDERVISRPIVFEIAYGVPKYVATLNEVMPKPGTNGPVYSLSAELETAFNNKTYGKELKKLVPIQ